MTEKQLVEAINAKQIAGVKADVKMKKAELEALYALVNRPEPGDEGTKLVELQTALDEALAAKEELAAANTELSKALTSVEKGKKTSKNPTGKLNGVEYEVRRGATVIFPTGNKVMTAQEIAESPEALQRLIHVKSPLIKRLG